MKLYETTKESLYVGETEEVEEEEGLVTFPKRK